MELFKQEMELFLLFPDLRSKTFWTKYLPILLRSPNTVLETGNGMIQTGYGIISPASCPFSKPCFTRLFTFSPRSLKLIIKTGNKIIQTGNGIISSNSWPSILKLLLQNGSNFYQRV